MSTRASPTDLICAVPFFSNVKMSFPMAPRRVAAKSTQRNSLERRAPGASVTGAQAPSGGGSESDSDTLSLSLVRVDGKTSNEWNVEERCPTKFCGTPARSDKEPADRAD
ncbi:hypothetical protein PR003_g34988 [Phytophthora rubi]|uniref:Uncharacterized protein n=1 Tax=Phytophthora rubi TaxID=129364 RepID=A0A6A3G0U2_9STRA|nr:hypothetical protein PR001_g33892 [Phytophthora rubi]KAE9258977.1 hypothetical protein PR003_g34988 [Phytophthora rubi]